MPAKSKESVTFWRHRKQADFDLSKVCQYLIVILVLLTYSVPPSRDPIQEQKCYLIYVKLA
jgi:hypothetical protein